MKRFALPLIGRRAAVLAAALSLWLGLPAGALAQQGEAPTASKGENFSAKPPAELFKSDCTGAGCHTKPQGLAKAAGLGLAGFLREHYTNSRESAAALASYLSKLPSGPEPKEKESRSSRPPKGAASTSERAGFSPGEPGSASRPEPREARTPKPGTRAARTPPRHEEEGAEKEKPVTATAHNHPAAAEPGEKEKPAPAARSGQRGHAATAAATGSTAAPAATPEPEPAPAPKVEAPPAPAAAAPPKPKQFDIFD